MGAGLGDLDDVFEGCPQRAIEGSGIAYEDHQAAGGHGPHHHPLDAEPEHDGGDDRPEDIHEPRKPLSSHRGSQTAFQTGRALSVESLSCSLLLAEDTGHAHGRQGLVHHRSQGPLALPFRSRTLFGAGAVHGQGDQQDGNRGNEHQGQSPVQPKEHGAHADDEDHAMQNLRDGLGHGVLQALDIAGDACHQVAGGPAVVELERHPLDVVKQGGAEVKYDGPTRPVEVER